MVEKTSFPPPCVLCEAKSHDGFFTFDAKAPFLEVPNGLSIAHWFCEELPKPVHHGTEGIDLWRDVVDGKSVYCYLWIMATVDLDLSYYWLLDIRTAPTPVEFGETRDFLMVWWDFNDGVRCEWHNHPIEFLAGTEEHRDRLWAGLQWFHGRVMSEIEADRPGCAKVAQSE